MNDKHENLFVFHGCDRKVGTSMVSHCTAKLISDLLRDKKVLFTALNGNDELHYSRGNTSSIDNIKIRVDNNLITAQEIENACSRDGNLYVMGGVSGVFKHRNFSVEFPQLFLSRALEAFDIVIVDCGNELDSGLCIGSLKSGGINIMVINQNEGSLLRFEGAEEIYKAIDTEFSLWIVNRFSDNDVHDEAYLKKRLGSYLKGGCYRVREELSVSRLAEIDEQLIIDYKCPGYTEDMKDIAYELLRITGINESVRDIGRKRKFGFM